MREGLRIPRSAEIAHGVDVRHFLDSHRARAVRAREYERLTDAVMSGVAALHATAANPGDEPAVRRSPDRCLMQFGPVALTVAWLRGTADSPSAGELLVIVWRGLVAPGRRDVTDRTTVICTPVRSATVLWEEALTAVAADEASWLWRPAGVDIGGYRSAELAERCVDRLRCAYTTAATAASDDSARLALP